MGAALAAGDQLKRWLFVLLVALIAWLGKNMLDSSSYLPSIHRVGESVVFVAVSHAYPFYFSPARRIALSAVALMPFRYSSSATRLCSCNTG